jgi:hypothetical protein
MTAEGDIIYGGSSGTGTRLAKGSDAQVLTLASGVPTWATSTVGDITSIVAGTGLTGSSLTSGDATLNVIGGTGITANANDIAVDASQTQITAIGTIGTGVWQGTPIATAYIADNAITLDKLAGGTDGNIISFDASGNPVAIATGNDGQVLTSAGTGAPPAFEDAAAGGGITHASQWRTNATASGSTSYDPLVNFEAADTDGAGTIGTAMTYSSGVFTFPVAGVWQIDFTVGVYQNGTNTNYFACFIETDNGTGSFAEAARGRNNMGATGEATNTNLSFIFDVTDVSDHKVQFKITDLPTNAIVNASTSLNRTFANFIRLGDT